MSEFFINEIVSHYSLQLCSKRVPLNKISHLPYVVND